MASTYSQIATQTLGSATSTVTFSSIPQTYTNLVLVSSAAVVSSSGDLLMTFNTDTGTNYSYTTITGNGTTAISARSSNRNNIPCDYNGWLSTTLGNNICVISIMSYANTTTFKTALTRSNNGPLGTDANVGMWRSTAAINQIVFVNNAGSNFATGSTFTLYGIKGA